MSTYSSFVYGSGVIYGLAETTGPYTLGNFEFMADNLLRLRFTGGVVANEEVFKPTNYRVVFSNNPLATDVRVRRILPIPEDTYAVSEIFLEIDAATPGTYYSVYLDNLTGRDGTLLVDTILSRKGRHTKTNSLLHSVPGHFDKTASSTIRHLLTAVGYADDNIGGDLAEPEVLPMNSLDPLAGFGVPVTAVKVIHWADGGFTRNSLATYWDGTTFSRYDFGRLRQIRDGVFLEQTSTNYFRYSNNMTAGLWVKDGAITATYPVEGPAGAGTVATRFAWPDGTLRDISHTLSAISAFANTDFTYSFWARSVSGTAECRAVTTRKDGSTGTFNFTISPTFTRYSFTDNTLAGGTTPAFVLRNAGVSASSARTIEFFGLQVEPRPYATSLIETSGSAEVRASETMSHIVFTQLNSTHRFTVSLAHVGATGPSPAGYCLIRHFVNQSQYDFDASTNFRVRSNAVTAVLKNSAAYSANTDMTFTVYPTQGAIHATGFVDPVWQEIGTAWAMPSGTYCALGAGTGVPCEGYISDVYQVY